MGYKVSFNTNRTNQARVEYKFTPVEYEICDSKGIKATLKMTLIKNDESMTYWIDKLFNT